MNDGENENLGNGQNIRNNSNALLDAYVDKEYRKKNIEAINNRQGKNENQRRHSDEEESSSNKKTSSLEEKDGLEDKKGLNKEDKKEGKDSKPQKGFKDMLNTKAALEGLSGLAALKQKWLKLTITMKILSILIPVIFGIILFATIIVYLDSVASAVTNFFGIPEADVENSNGEITSGFFTDDEYLYDENGNELSEEEAISKLYERGDECKVTIWTRIKDFFNTKKEFSDRCSFMRYVRKKTESNNPPVDTALIISSIMNGYGSNPDPTNYKDNDDVPDDYLSTANNYQSLERILNDSDLNINRQTIDDIVENSITKKTFIYYEFVPFFPKSTEGECKKRIFYEEEYNLDKWKVFMRFGEEAASKLDEVNYTFYLQEKNSKECKDIQVEETYSDAFYQYANVDSKTKDVFQNYESLTFDYTNGYAYQNFPGFASAINNSATTVTYDEVFTPKFVEQLIQNMVYQKVRINEILLKSDPDSADPFAQIGGTSSVSGGYCSEYLSADPAETMVSLTDCHGKYLKTVTFEDYIIGVANAEVSNTHDNYVLSEMLAAISYAYHRRNNYARGNTISMKSGTCDQAYCSMKEGCYSVSNPEICSGCASFYIGGRKGKNPGLYPKYQSLYRTAVKYLVVSNGRVHNAHYVSTIQNEWKRKALAGLYFTDIIAQTYASEGAEVIECTDYGQTQTEEVPPEEKVGNETDNTYTKLAPDLGKYYGFSYADNNDGVNISINPKWKNANLTTISPSCSNSSFSSMKFTVHKNAVSSYKKAFDGICKLLTSGVKLSNGEKCKYSMDHLMGGSTFSETKTQFGNLDLRPYGLSQSWNYNGSFQINGKSYIPYAPSSSSEKYYEFVNAIGGEETCQNINFILWKYAYKDAGFRWGGNNGGGLFNPSLFEIKY